MNVHVLVQDVVYSGSRSFPSSTPSNSSSSAGFALAAVLGRWGMSPSGSV